MDFTEGASKGDSEEPREEVYDSTREQERFYQSENEAKDLGEPGGLDKAQKSASGEYTTDQRWDDHAEEADALEAAMTEHEVGSPKYEKLANYLRQTYEQMGKMLEEIDAEAVGGSTTQRMGESAVRAAGSEPLSPKNMFEASEKEQERITYSIGGGPLQRGTREEAAEAARSAREEGAA